MGLRQLVSGMIWDDCCEAGFSLRRFQYQYCRWNCLKRYLKLAVALLLIVIIIEGLLDPVEITVTVQRVSESTPDKNVFPCENASSKAYSAYNRAKTEFCRREIVRYECLLVENKLFPAEITSVCPLNNMTAKGELMGCYSTDVSSPVLAWAEISLPDDNSPENCVKFCIGVGFAYAGLQAGKTCHCGDKINPTANRLSPIHCGTHLCPGDQTKACGGLKTAQVFRTGIHSKDFLPPQKFVEPPANVSLDSSPVKILFFFVVSGRSARQVVRLLNLIYSQHHFYYIHVDVRCDYLYDQLIHLESKVDNIKLKRQRLTVVWAGPSQISVLIESLRDLFGGLYGQWRWDFVINLTESDFPLWTLSDFEWFLASHPGKNFLHPTSSEKNYPAVQGFDRSFLECEGRMWQFGRRKIPDGFTLYGVSEHYIITKEFAQYVSSTSPDSQLTDINLMFNHTILAPETYLATVLINSRFCGTAVWQNLRHVNWVSTTRKKCLRKNLVDWCISSPNDFRYGDEKKFLSTFNPRYFGRKFEAIVDQRVIEALEARLVERLYQQFGKINSNFTTADRPGLHSYWENHYSKKYDNKSVAHGTAELLVDLAGLSLNKLAKIRKSHDAQAEHITKTFFYRVDPVNMTVLRDEDNSSDILVGFTVACEPHLIAHRKSIEQMQLESRIRRLNTFKLVDETDEDLGLVHNRLQKIEIGTDYDIKEKIFRNYLGLINRNQTITIMHQWGNGKPIQIKLELRTEHDNIVVAQKVFDLGETEETFDWSIEPNLINSTDKKNHFTLSMQLRLLYAGRLVATVDAVIQEDTRMARATEKQFVAHLSHLTRYYDVVDTCLISLESTGRHRKNCGFGPLQPCHRTTWSSLSPDPKSEFKPLRYTNLSH